jgi:hypothetical protein
MNANPGVSITEWGRHGWGFLHAVAFTAPVNLTPQQSAEYQGFFRAVGRVLPCTVCRDHYQSFGDVPVFRTRRDVAEYVGALHNDVNQRLGKPLVSLSCGTAKYLPEQRWDTVLQSAEEVEKASDCLRTVRARCAWTRAGYAAACLVVLLLLVLSLHGLLLGAR